MGNYPSWQELNAIPILEVAKHLGIAVMRGNKALCFSGHDKEPSLSFRVSHNRWKCFGCNKGGDVIQLVKDALNYDHIKAAAWLRHEFMMDNGTPYLAKPSIKVLRNKKVEVDEENEIDAELLEWLLDNCPLRESGRSYLAGRGYSPATIDYFQVGELAEPQKIFDLAKSKWGIPRLKRAGLVNVSESGRDNFLWFFSTLLFPFIANGKIVYIQGRSMSIQAKARWMGLKGIRKPLYNVDLLKTLERGDDLYLCEGITDTLAAYQLKINAVGILGAHSFNNEWLKLLSPYRIYIAFDADGAGQAGGKEIRNKFKQIGVSAIPIDLMGHKDLAEYFRSINLN